MHIHIEHRPPLIEPVSWVIVDWFSQSQSQLRSSGVSVRPPARPSARPPARSPGRPPACPPARPPGLCTGLAKMADHDRRQTS